jgi:predicted adenylyl cyclase CyaB
VPVNVEIKARARDLARQERVAAGLSDTPVQIIAQEDVFFATDRGRLKLRILAPDRGELIRYERPDHEGPRTSTYTVEPTDDPASLRAELDRRHGVIGVVRKTRRLYLAGRTRIHCDEVEGLGSFLELEVVMRDGEPESDGVRVARELMTALGIRDEDLLSRAYIDLLLDGHDGA